MAYIPIEKLLKDTTSLYQLVMAGAKRATELSQGIPPLIQTSSKKISTIALEEIAEGKVQWEKTKEAEGKEEKKESEEKS